MFGFILIGLVVAFVFGWALSGRFEVEPTLGDVLRVTLTMVIPPASAFFFLIWLVFW